MLNGVSQLIMTKADVLDSFDTIRAATAYKIGNEVVTDFPYEIDDNTKPVYTDLKGWKTDLTKVRNKSEFPQELKDYIAFLEKELEVPVTYVSVGPDREQIIKVK